MSSARETPRARKGEGSPPRGVAGGVERGGRERPEEEREASNGTASPIPSGSVPWARPSVQAKEERLLAEEREERVEVLRPAFHEADERRPDRKDPEPHGEDEAGGAHAADRGVDGFGVLFGRAAKRLSRAGLSGAVRNALLVAEPPPAGEG